MLIDVVESVLCDIANDQIGVLPDLTTLVGLGVTDEQLDESRLSGTVRSKNGDTGGEGALERDVVQLLLSRAGILEADFAHLEQTLLFGLDTIEQRGVGELEAVVLSSLKRVVGFCFRDRLYEGLEVTPVTLDLETIDVQNVGDGVVEEGGVVGDDDCKRC